MRRGTVQYGIISAILPILATLVCKFLDPVLRRELEEPHRIYFLSVVAITSALVLLNATIALMQAELFPIRARVTVNMTIIAIARALGGLLVQLVVAVGGGNETNVRTTTSSTISTTTSQRLGEDFPLANETMTSASFRREFNVTFVDVWPKIAVYSLLGVVAAVVAAFLIPESNGKLLNAENSQRRGRLEEKLRECCGKEEENEANHEAIELNPVETAAGTGLH